MFKQPKYQGILEKKVVRKYEEIEYSARCTKLDINIADNFNFTDLDKK